MVLLRYGFDVLAFFITSQVSEKRILTWKNRFFVAMYNLRSCMSVTNMGVQGL